MLVPYPVDHELIMVFGLGKIYYPSTRDLAKKLGVSSEMIKSLGFEPIDKETHKRIVARALEVGIIKHRYDSSAVEAKAEKKPKKKSRPSFLGYFLKLFGACEYPNFARKCH